MAAEAQRAPRIPAHATSMAALAAAPNVLWNEDERRGAMKALLALLDLAGSDAAGAIFGIPQEKAA